MELPSQSEFVQFDPNIDVGAKGEKYHQYDLYEEDNREPCKQEFRVLQPSLTLFMNSTDDATVDNESPYQHEREVFGEGDEQPYAPLSYTRNLPPGNHDLFSEDHLEADTFSRRRTATPDHTLQFEKTGPFVVPGHADRSTSSDQSHRFRQPVHIFSGTREKPEEMRSNAGAQQHLHAPDGPTSVTNTKNSVHKQFGQEIVPAIARAEGAADRPIQVKRGLCLVAVCQSDFIPLL